MKAEEHPLSQKPLIPEGPWNWVINEASNIVILQSEKSGRDTVMDFVRYGMQLGQPRFNVDGRMVKAQDLGVIVEGREHHAEWFKYIDHPVAKALQRVPELLKAEQELETKKKEHFDSLVFISNQGVKISELEETISKKDYWTKQCEESIRVLEIGIKERDAKLEAILKGLREIKEANDAPGVIGFGWLEQHVTDLLNTANKP